MNLNRINHYLIRGLSENRENSQRDVTLIELKYMVSQGNFYG